MEQERQRVDWLFGRGLSMGCGLTWSMPETWNCLPRERVITQIETTLRAEMCKPAINVDSLKDFLWFLATKTTTAWYHQFYATNWDYLLQRELSSFVRHYGVIPKWLGKSHVFHVNGTVEPGLNSAYRSNIVLETDAGNARRQSLEAEKALDALVWNKTFVVVGMSFECGVDKFLLGLLGRLQDSHPVGSSDWIVVNPDQAALSMVCQKLRQFLPAARVCPVNATFGAWVKTGTPELKILGVIQ